MLLRAPVILVQYGKTNLLLYVVERVRAVDGKADKDNMGVGVAERAESIVIFLTSRIPQGKLNVLAVHFDVGDVVLEHGRHVHLSMASVRQRTQGAYV